MQAISGASERRALAPGAPCARLHAWPAEGRIVPPPHVPALARATYALAFAGLMALMRVIVLVHFRRAHVFGRERFPRRGPTLVVANHPSTWTDVVVLDVLLGRRMHYLALEELFRAWPGSMLLAVHGALPVSTAGEPGSRSAHNVAVFRRCEALFDHGEVVAMFPEGVSRSDGSLLPLKPGAARLALTYVAHPEHDRRFRVLPVAIRYSDRRAFQSDVVVNVGDPVELGDLAGEALEVAVPRLTARMADSLDDLMPSVAGPGRRALVTVLEAVTRDRPEAPGTERMRALAHAVAALEAGDPAGHARLARRARRYDRARRALRLTDRALAEHRGGRLAPLRAAASALAMVAALVPATAGALLHAIPAYVIERFAARYEVEPMRMSFARIGGGLVLFPPWYVLIAAVATQAFGLPLEWVPLLWLGGAVLGLLAIHERRWVRGAVERGRVAWLGVRAPRLLRRAREDWLALARAAETLEARGAGMGHAEGPATAAAAVGADGGRTGPGGTGRMR